MHCTAEIYLQSCILDCHCGFMLNVQNVVLNFILLMLCLLEKQETQYLKKNTRIKPF